MNINPIFFPILGCALSSGGLKFLFEFWLPCSGRTGWSCFLGGGIWELRGSQGGGGNCNLGDGDRENGRGGCVGVRGGGRNKECGVEGGR